MLGRANRLEIGSKIGLIPIGFQSRLENWAKEMGKKGIDGNEVLINHERERERGREGGRENSFAWKR